MSAGTPLFVGVDVGATKVAAAAVSGGDAEAAVEHPTRLESGEALIDGIEAAVREVADRMGAPAGVGIGVPSQVEWETGRVVASVNVPLEGVPLRDLLAERLGVPVRVDNDGNCAALAEALGTGSAPARHLVMYTVGTGVGGGLVIDGRIYRGASGLGAELGHLTIDADGPECPGNCPGRGCLEAVCSGLALERDATALGRSKPGSRLGALVAEHGVATGRDTVALAREGDRDARELVDGLGRWLGVGIALALNAFEPERVVVGGGLSRHADLFWQTAVGVARSRALPSIAARSEISLARLGPAAGVIGAGLLAQQEHERAGAEVAAR